MGGWRVRRVCVCVERKREEERERERVCLCVCVQTIAVYVCVVGGVSNAFNVRVFVVGGVGGR